MSPALHRLAALVTGSLVIAACSFDWASVDPREAGSQGGGTTSGGGATSSSATGGTGGTGGEGATSSSSSTTGGGSSTGGAAPDPLESCVDWCVVFYGCEGTGFGGGGAGGGIPRPELRQLCADECSFFLDLCPRDEIPALLACMDLVQTCDDLIDFQICASMLTCPG